MWKELKAVYKLEAKKRIKYFAEVEIAAMVSDWEEEGNYYGPGKVIRKKSFDSKIRAQKWIAKMTAMNEVDFFLMNKEEQKKYKDEHNIKDFMVRVNEIAKELFGKPLYKIYGDKEERNDYIPDDIEKSYINSEEYIEL